MAGSLEFARVFLFRCAECGRPLASACASPQNNLEMADAHLFNPHCHSRAKNHYLHFDFEPGNTSRRPTPRVTAPLDAGSAFSAGLISFPEDM